MEFNEFKKLVTLINKASSMIAESTDLNFKNTDDKYSIEIVSFVNMINNISDSAYRIKHYSNVLSNIIKRIENEDVDNKFMDDSNEEILAVISDDEESLISYKDDIIKFLGNIDG